MKFSLNKKLITGTAIPVSALRTEASCGIGEFCDLKCFADWCKKVNIDLIQLLPVNDTGYQSSPYSALSAFALHPIYINIMEIPEAKLFKDEFNSIKKTWDSKSKVYFNGVLLEKIKLLKKIFQKNYKNINKNIDIKSWEKTNTWINGYALFSYLKEENNCLSWLDWKKFKNLTSTEINKLYFENKESLLFYSWVQFNLEKQFKDAAQYIESLNINLKGDLPILMNVDSADVWQYRDIFKVQNRAGAPPDMFSDEGQNWGFPTYSWKEMEKDNYKWWKERLKQAAKFYHAYRIDHVLGFFRIWTIPPKYESASMGYYSPNCYLSLEDLSNIGLNGSRLKWLTEPHVPGYELRDNLGLESNEVIKVMLDQIENEDLYLFKQSIASTKDIKAIETISDEAKYKMINFYQNITIMQISEDQYITTWFFYNSRAFHSLSDHEKYLLSELLNRKGQESMTIWKNQGLKLLKFMKDSQNMLVCAEDLGTIPHCVPEVLEELRILGLHITRWSKRYEEYGEPYMKPSEYNYLSVSTPAVHDSTTVRQWWPEQSVNNEISNALNKDWLGHEATPENVYTFYEALLKTSSQIAMFQFQDLLAIDENLRGADINKERINVPGTVNDENWSYRMENTIESLIKNSTFTEKLSNLLIKRG